MKKIVFTLLIALAAAYVAFGQSQVCPPDSLFNPSPPSTSSAQTDSLEDAPLQCYTYPCKVVVCHRWEFPPNFSGMIEIWSNTPQPIWINVQISQDCHLVRFDSCVSVALPNIVKWDTLLNLPQRSQLSVCGAPAQITVALKEFPETDTLPTPFCNTDTLCAPTAIANQQQQPATYYDLEALGKVVLEGDLLPNRRYKRIR